MHSVAKISGVSAGVAGAAATFVGVGLGRFAYTPIIPAMVGAGWFTAPEAAYLGAANLLGYFIGAVAADRLAHRFGAMQVILAAFVVVTASLFMCAWPSPYHWFAGWRLAAGIGGGVLMVVGGSTAITAVPAEQRARVGSFVFTGVGLGILVSAVAVPALLRTGLSATWLGIAAVATLITICVWRRWIHVGRHMAASSTAREQGGSPAPALGLAVALTLGAYALEAIGFIPHTIFWVDYLARELGRGMDVASIYWAVFGIGATAGALLSGELARHIGWQRGFMTALLLKAAAVALPLLSASWLALGLSSFIVGALVPGMVVFASGRLSELVGPSAHRRVWGYATAAFATAQALAGYGFAGLFSLTGSYSMHFAIGAAALAVGAVLVAAPRGSNRLLTRHPAQTKE
ncbi:MAG: YbfB/YjiJ family MFS transporter [Aquisalimonadaceae bacterium]